MKITKHLPLGSVLICKQKLAFLTQYTDTKSPDEEYWLYNSEHYIEVSDPVMYLGYHQYRYSKTLHSSGILLLYREQKVLIFHGRYVPEHLDRSMMLLNEHFDYLKIQMNFRGERNGK